MAKKPNPTKWKPGGFNKKPRPIKDEDWDAFVAQEPKLKEKKFPKNG